MEKLSNEEEQLIEEYEESLELLDEEEIKIELPKLTKAGKATPVYMLSKIKIKSILSKDNRYLVKHDVLVYVANMLLDYVEEISDITDILLMASPRKTITKKMIDAAVLNLKNRGK